MSYDNNGWLLMSDPQDATPFDCSDPPVTAEEAWQELLDKDDRTSPEEFPEMCLITLDELRDFMSRRRPEPPAPSKLYAETTKVRCCSAASPCNHQKRFPRTVCQACYDATHSPDKGAT